MLPKLSIENSDSLFRFQQTFYKRDKTSFSAIDVLIAVCESVCMCVCKSHQVRVKVCTVIAAYRLLKTGECFKPAPSDKPC